MTLDEKIVACLSASTSQTLALVGERVYNGEAIQGVQLGGSYVVFEQIYSDPAETHGGVADPEDSLDGTLYQFSCYGSNLLAAKALRKAVRSDLLAIGALPGVKVCTPIERTGDEPEIKLKRADLDVTMFHNPTA